MGLDTGDALIELFQANSTPSTESTELNLAQVSLQEMVKAGKMVSLFQIYEGDMWYVTECGFSFPVPCSASHKETFRIKEKASDFEGWIREHLETRELMLRKEVKTKQASVPPFPVLMTEQDLHHLVIN